MSIRQISSRVGGQVRGFLVASIAITCSLHAFTAGTDAVKAPDEGQIAISEAKLLEQGHFTRSPLDNAMSERLLTTFLETLDYNRHFFTQEDIDSFKAKYATELDDYILLGNMKPATEIHALYMKRVTDRIAKIEALLAKDYDFKSDHALQLNRQKLPWPKDAAEADAIWAARIEGELLQEKLNQYAIDPPKKVVHRRYSTLLKNLKAQDQQDVLNTFLSSLALSYDPHSEYLGPSELENFEISMRLSLVGIGAVLRSDDGYVKIIDIVPGGPADLQGQLKVNDRISGVAQGSSPFVDVVEMKLDKVVEMIRGTKGTKVRLQVIPGRGGESAERKIVEIVRDQVQIKEGQAKAEIIERTGPDGRTERLGWLTLPSFYADMSKTRSTNPRSTTRDVSVLLERLKKEGISGLVMDLRRNGGGSLEEAVNLTGLFIKNGPVVQTKDTNGTITVSRDRDSSITFDGPMVVLTSRLSASASEIFAAALQDYGRAVIVGDESTFGKGTVQSMLDLGRFLPAIGGDPQKAGALKLTIQQFYRVAGGSTQFRGVVSDVRIPTLTDNPEIGEASLKHPLPFDEVEPLRIDKFSDRPLFIEELGRRSAARVAASSEFAYVAEDIARLKHKLSENRLSLNEDVRRKEIAEEKSRTEARIASRKAVGDSPEKVFAVTLENVDKPDLRLAANEPKPRKPPTDTETDGPEEDKGPEVDAEKQEALNILSDLIELLRLPKTASAAK